MAEPFGLGPLGAGGLFSGFTGYGFNIPLGDPGAIESAASSARRLGQAFTDQARSVNVAARVAGDAAGGWRGEASSAFAGYSGTLVSTLSSNAGACERAATALSRLGQALGHAQQVTRKARSDCEHWEQEIRRHQEAAGTATQEAAAARQAAGSTPHPPTQQAFLRQAGDFEHQASVAAAAVTAAEGELNAAKQRGHSAYTTYEHEAQALASAISGAAGELKPAAAPAGGAPAAIASSPAEIALAARVSQMWGAGRASTPLVATVPASERTPGFVLALIRDQQQRFDASLAGGGARGPYSMWTSAQFGNRAATVNAAVTAGVLPPRPSNWAELSGTPRGQAYWRGASKFFSGITCQAGGCSVVKITGTGTASASQVIAHVARDSEWAAIGLCVFGSDGACLGATRFALAADTVHNAVEATSVPNLLEREAVTTAELTAGGPGFVKAYLGAAGKLDTVLPKSALGRFALNGVLTGPSAGVTAVAPALDRRLFPEAPPPPSRPHG